MYRPLSTYDDYDWPYYRPLSLYYNYWPSYMPSYRTLSYLDDVPIYRSLRLQRVSMHYEKQAKIHSFLYN
jgi:hypothetical protein